MGRCADGVHIAYSSIVGKPSDTGDEPRKCRLLSNITIIGLFNA